MSRKNVFAAVLLLWMTFVTTAQAGIIRFVYVSDSHYGLFRKFRGRDKVSSAEVNRALLDKINLLPTQLLPDDGGVGGGMPADPIDFVVNTGDIANRMEHGVQTARESWKQFAADWYGRLTLKNGSGRPTPLYLLPGNHDVTNAIGYPLPMTPERDATCLAEIYNRMMKPSVPRTSGTYSYETDKVDYMFTLGGIRWMFVGMWPDTRTRRWMAAQLAAGPKSEPVVLFTHDQPDVEAKHFVNPNGRHDLNVTDKFENLLSDTASVGYGETPVRERRQLADFLMTHREIKAYFHGNENYCEFYEWHCPDRRPVIPVFRVDSPMKGEYSATDERRLSFLFVCVDTDSLQMTVRECLWNAGDALAWGQSSTISLR